MELLSSTQIDFQHWLEVGAKCVVPAALNPPHNPEAGVTHISCQGARKAAAPVWRLRKKDASFQKDNKLRLLEC